MPNQPIQVAFGSPGYHAMVALRDEVLRKPLGLAFKPDLLADEHAEHHFAVFGEGGQCLACGIFRPVSAGMLKMRQVAVSPQLQGQGIGRQLVLFMEQWATAQGYAYIVMHARKTAVPFYLGLGYQTMGEEFEEVTVPHFKMGKRL